MDLGYKNNIVTTVGEIPESECFIHNDDIYIKTSCSGRVYTEIAEKNLDYFSTHCICVRLSDGIIDVFSPECSCVKILTKVSIA